MGQEDAEARGAALGELAVLNDPGLVQARRAELARRGIGEKSVKLPEGGRVAPPKPRAPAQ